MPNFEQLRHIEYEQGLTQLRTLLASHHLLLERMPKFQAELQVLLERTEVLDYVQLAQNIETALALAQELVLVVDLAPVDYPTHPDLLACGQQLLALAHSGNVRALRDKFRQACDEVKATAQAEASAKAQRQHAAQAQAEQEAAEQAKKKACAQRREKARALGYIDHGDGTVTDTRTGLMWKQCAEGQLEPDGEQGQLQEMNWYAAVALPKQLQHQPGFAGYNDWRLPTKDELASLVMKERANPCVCTEAFPNCQSLRFWTSSFYVGGSSGAWYIYFDNGYVGYGSRGNNYAVRLVRASQ